jgi:malate dehydrogenase
MSAARAICDHMHDWFSGTEPGKWTSMGVTSGKYDIPEGLIYSYPVTVRNGQWSIVESLDISPFSREKMNATMKELQEEREAATRFLPKVQLRVCITGAAGQVACSLFSQIAEGNVFGKDKPITLVLLDVESKIEDLYEIKTVLMECNLPLLTEVVTTADPDVAFMKVDVAILIGAKPREEGMKQKDLVNVNGGIFMEQGKSLDKYAKKSVKVLVVGNPANTNCLITMLNAPSIPRENFTALTHLDQNRAQAMIAKRLNVRCNKMKNIIIWGNHSNTQYVDPAHAYVITDQGKQGVCNAVKDDTWLQGEFLQTIQERGAAAIAAGKAICDHMQSWFSGTKPGEWTSMGVISGKYDVPEGLIYSYPVTTRNGEWSIVEGLEISAFSREKMNAAAKELQEEREAAAEFMPKA